MELRLGCFYDWLYINQITLSNVKATAMLIEKLTKDLTGQMPKKKFLTRRLTKWISDQTNITSYF